MLRSISCVVFVIAMQHLVKTLFRRTRPCGSENLLVANMPSRPKVAFPLRWLVPHVPASQNCLESLMMIGSGRRTGHPGLDSGLALTDSEARAD